MHQSCHSKSIMKRFFVILSLLICPSIESATRILAFFPVPGPSHHFFFQPILRGLAQQGHHVDYYSPFPLKDPHVNITHIQIENMMDQLFNEFSLWDHSKLPVLQQRYEVWRAWRKADSRLCQTESIKDLLKSNASYDLFIHESLYIHETALVFQHKFNVPSVALGAIADFFQMNEFSGLTFNPSYMVEGFADNSVDMNFLGRLRNTYIYAGYLLLEYHHLILTQRIIDKCFVYPGWETRPPLSELLANQSLILVNNHPSVGYPFPTPPHVKEIGGAVLQNRKPLPKDLEDFINGAKYGIIYFSLGSLFDWEKADKEMKDTFVKVFSTRKERILWKLPYDSWETLPSNVKISRWFPQQDILAQRNVKLFITHGGLQSTFETVHYAVPAVVIPAFADQVRNALAIVHHGYGVRLMLNNITETSVTWALDEVLFQPKYKQTIMRGSALLKDRVMDPIDESVYWIEYVLRYGNVLQPAGARLNFVQRHCLDIITFVLIVALVAFYSIKKLFSWGFRKIFISLFAHLNKEKQD